MDDEESHLVLGILDLYSPTIRSIRRSDARTGAGKSGVFY